MTTVKQLGELQDLDLELEAHAENLRQLEGQLGESAALREASEHLAQESERLEKLRHDQQSLEWQIDDLAAKIDKGRRSSTVAVSVTPRSWPVWSRTSVPLPPSAGRAKMGRLS